MAEIKVLDQNTIDQIAAGEVIERPSAVVKELTENAIDAGATAIAVEIKDGGTTFIRITDNGCGIEKEQVPLAFLRHSTSKIRKPEDLIGVSSLGFRGEALSSIASIAQVELITKTSSDPSGLRYEINGGKEKGLEEIGAPEGTTFIVRNLFYNTPARRKFLKSPKTEAGYINEIIEKLALSHPEISFKFVNNNQTKLHTSGNTNLKDIIYHIYGREIAANLIPIEVKKDFVSFHGFIGSPAVSRANRNYENYFINGRFVKSSLIAKAIEDGYKSFMMQHKYPFVVLLFDIDGDTLDVNVHPTKMELRFSNQEELYELVSSTIKEALQEKELIPKVKLVKEESVQVPEKREKNFLDDLSDSPAPAKKPAAPRPEPSAVKPPAYPEPPLEKKAFAESTPPASAIAEPSPSEESKNLNYFISEMQKRVQDHHAHSEPVPAPQPVPEETEQLNLFEEKLLTKEARQEHKIIGQVFDTYWLVQYKEELFIIDQHAAHEKVLYEKMVKDLSEKTHTAQMIDPPIVLTLSMQEQNLLQKYMDNFTQIGFEIEPFGGKEYAVRAVPGNLYNIAKKELLLEMLDNLSDIGGNAPELINEKLASMSCKAAVKGNNRLSASEMDQLIEDLLLLENPYHCPHGRPTIISMSKTELEKKFKRIV